MFYIYVIFDDRVDAAVMTFPPLRMTNNMFYITWQGSHLHVQLNLFNYRVEILRGL